jgi:hypothetical protein
LSLSDDQDHFLHGEWECDHAQQDQKGEEENEDEDGEKEGKQDEDKKKIFVVGSL